MAVLQEKNPKKRTKDGRSWYYDVYYINEDGIRKEKKSKYFKSKSEAKEAERNFLNSLSNKNIPKIVFFDQLYLEWLNLKQQRLKETTYYRLKGNLNLHILSYFKGKNLNNISYNTLTEWKNNLHKKNISIEYQNKIIGYLKEILEYAHKYYDFDSKIYDRIQKYRIDTPQEKLSDAEVNFWTYEEWKIFIDNVDDKFYYILFNFLYYTGLRYGEMNALNWNDIDLNKKTLKVTKSLSNKIEGQKYIITSPKTANSRRIIDLDDNLIELLKEHKKNEKMIYNFSKDMFIFGNINYIPPTTFNRYLNSYINKAQVKRITPHGFRHSHVSLLIDLGCDSRDVAERIGDTVEMVEKTYYHMFPKKKKNTVDALNILKKTR